MLCNPSLQCLYKCHVAFYLDVSLMLCLLFFSVSLVISSSLFTLTQVLTGVWTVTSTELLLFFFTVARFLISETEQHKLSSPATFCTMKTLRTDAQQQYVYWGMSSTVLRLLHCIFLRYNTCRAWHVSLQPCLVWLFDGMDMPIAFCWFVTQEFPSLLYSFSAFILHVVSWTNC